MKEKGSDGKIRESNIELLRIVAMIMIIVHHLSYYTQMYARGTLSNRMLGVILTGIGQISVSIFVFVTGYFQINKDFNIKKVLKLWLQIVFYSAIMYIICVKLNPKINKRDILGVFLPISYNGYWFISVYMLMYILTPFLNKFAKSIGKETYKNFLMVFLFIFSIIYTILCNSVCYSTGMGNLDSVAWFCFLYLLSGYIKIYGIKFLENKKKVCGLLLTIFMIYSFILMIINYMGQNRILFWYTKINSIFVFTIALLIFYIFKNIKIKSSKIINYIASLTFAVYLTHENYLLKYMFWNWIKETISIWPDTIFDAFIQMFISIIIIYATTAIIELIRKKLENLIFKSKRINEFAEKLNKKINV